jgi:hypothetical protein
MRARTGSTSLRLERNDRVDYGGTPSREPGGADGGKDQGHDGEDVRARIMSSDAEQQALR